MPSLFIIGNGFDRAHGLKTSYWDFKEWLLVHRRLDVIAELQSIFPAHKDYEFLLWSQFEEALTQYDVNAVEEWAWDSLYVTIEESGGREIFTSGDVLDTAIIDIVHNNFSAWVDDIEVCGMRIFDFDNSAKFITFNYTETLEHLYSIPAERILHIHGKAHSDSGIIVGHRTMIDPLSGSFENNDLRGNNNRIQNFADLADMYKPSEEIIRQNSAYFNSLNDVDAVIVFGHSCSDIDELYFKATAENVRPGAIWRFCYFNEQEDLDNIKRLIDAIHLDRNHISLELAEEFIRKQYGDVYGSNQNL